MRLDGAALDAAHDACVSAQPDGSSEKFQSWLDANDIDGDGLLSNASLGGEVWLASSNGREEDYTSAIVAGFEWGYRAREFQELFS